MGGHLNTIQIRWHSSIVSLFLFLRINRTLCIIYIYKYTIYLSILPHAGRPAANALNPTLPHSHIHIAIYIYTYKVSLSQNILLFYRNDVDMVFLFCYMCSALGLCSGVTALCVSDKILFHIPTVPVYLYPYHIYTVIYITKRLQMWMGTGCMATG